MSAGQSRISKKQKETYTVLNFLGRGGFGETYLIKSDETRINYVIKRIFLDVLCEADRKNVMNEAHILKMIDHPNIIKFKEVFKVIKPIRQLDIIMEYANGGDINQKMKKQYKKFFEENLLIDWLTQLCNALQYIHKKKIIHRDIKPANIFLNNLGQIKLGDFGVSKNLETIKMAKTFTGTLHYLAPEIINGDNYSFEADIWSLGVTFYELMTFRKPFEGNFPLVYFKILNNDIEPITDFYSKEFRYLIYSMLNKDPSKRPKAKEILKMSFIKNRMLSYLQEKHFNIKDSFSLIKNYYRKKNAKLNDNKNIKNYNVNNGMKNNINNVIYNNMNMNMNIVYNANKLNFVDNKNQNTNNINNIFKNTFNIKSNKELNKNQINKRYQNIDNKNNNNEKISHKDKYNLFRFSSMQMPEKKNKLIMSQTKINKDIGHLNQEDKKIKIKDLTSSQQIGKNFAKFKMENRKNDRNDDNLYYHKYNSSTKFKSCEIKNLINNDKDKDSYDLHRQMNIFDSIINGNKTDEQIEEENNILLNNYDYDNNIH